MGNMLTRRPDLFGAVVCGSPLLDMKRYNHLLAGASWMGEYGNPDVPEEWAFIRDVLAVPQRRGSRRSTPAPCSPPRPATTASTPATPARWSPG